MSTGILFPIFENKDTNFTPLIPTNSNCTEGVQWIWITVGQCVVNIWGWASLIFGLISLFLCIVTILPQIIVNCRRGLTAQAVSIYFILFLLFGDLCNLVGCILTHQLIFQTIIAVYSVFIDIVLIGQCMFYKTQRQVFVHRIMEVDDRLADDNSIDRYNNDVTLSSSSDTFFLDGNCQATARDTNHVRRLSCWLLASMSLGATIITYYDISLFRIPQRSTLFVASGSRSMLSRRLLEWYNVKDSQHIDPYPRFLIGFEAIIGYVLGWISACMYICSRLPQIYKNYKRKSTEGLSVYMFFMTITSNVCYGMQIILYSTERNYLLRSVPWLVGGFGVLLFDFTATLSNQDACKVWRARDRLRSTLLAIFPASVIGNLVTVTLLDETRVTGRLTSCDGFMNLELDDGVLIRFANCDESELDVEFVQSLTICGPRIRYINVPEDLDICRSLKDWDALAPDHKFIPRPIKASKTEKKVSNETNSLPNASGSSKVLSRIENFQITSKHLKAFKMYNLEVTGDEKIDKIMAQTIDCLLDDD